MDKINKLVFEHDSYSESVITGFGSWIDKCPNRLAAQIINNIRTVNYNYDYGVHDEISLLSIIMFDRSPIYRAIDRVIGSIDITTINKKKEDNEYEYACDKKSLSKLILNGNRKIILVNPNSKKLRKYSDIIASDLEFYNEMTCYLEVIVRFLSIRFNNVINDLLIKILRYE